MLSVLTSPPQVVASGATTSVQCVCGVCSEGVAVCWAVWTFPFDVYNFVSCVITLAIVGK